MKVTFCGHGDIDCSHLEDLLYDTTEKLILQGADEFHLGGYGKFDIMCATVLRKLKTKYPHISSVLVLAYLNQSYNKELYDFTEYPPIENTPKPFAILKRNEYMVKKSDAVIAFVVHSFGGSAKTLRIAEKYNKQIINLA